jgi:glutaryl-CoA dehydrogenase
MLSMDPVALDGMTALDAVLTEDEILTRDTVRQFVTDKFIPTIADHFENHTFPEDLIPELAQLGILGASIKGYGCTGVNAVTYGLILQE